MQCCIFMKIILFSYNVKLLHSPLGLFLFPPPFLSFLYIYMTPVGYCLVRLVCLYIQSGAQGGTWFDQTGRTGRWLVWGTWCSTTWFDQNRERERTKWNKTWRQSTQREKERESRWGLDKQEFYEPRIIKSHRLFFFFFVSVCFWLCYFASDILCCWGHILLVIPACVDRHLGYRILGCPAATAAARAMYSMCDNRHSQLECFYYTYWVFFFFFLSIVENTNNNNWKGIDEE